MHAKDSSIGRKLRVSSETSKCEAARHRRGRKAWVLGPPEAPVADLLPRRPCDLLREPAEELGARGLRVCEAAAGDLVYALAMALVSSNISLT